MKENNLPLLVAIVIVLVASIIASVFPVDAQGTLCLTPKIADVNIRYSHSADTEKVGTLGYGEKISIIKKYNRWYKVPFGTMEAWIADWVVSEVECTYEQQQPTTQVVIDNYCFISNDCTTDAEWAQGYEDYQRDHPGGQIIAQPVMSAPVALWL